MKVWPKNDEIRKTLKHPVGGGFTAGVSAPAEWPKDQFTIRRLKDGTIVKKAPPAPDVIKKAPAPSKPAA